MHCDPKYSKRNTFKSCFFCFITVALVVYYPVLFLYFNNLTELECKELLLPIIVLGGISIILYLAIFIYSRDIYITAIITCILMLVFCNYKYLETGIQNISATFKIWHIVPTVFFLLVWLAIFIKNKLTLDAAKNLMQIIVITFSSLLFFNLISGLVSLLSVSETITENVEPEQGLITQVDSSKLPNVYWLIFDEYSNSSVMENFYGYDNSEFENNLLSKGFYISQESYNNSATTSTVLTNYINGAYIADDNMTEATKQELRYQVQILKRLESLGYNSKLVGDTDFWGLPSELNNVSQKSGGTTVSGDSFFSLIMKNTLIADCFPSNNDENINLILETLQYLKDPQKTNGNYVLSYLCSPHQPFYFKSDGTYNDLTNLHNWDDKEYYLGQYIFISNEIEKIVENLLAQDNNCIIIIQSDHSARYLVESGELVIPPKERMHIFNAVYYKGQDMSIIEGLDGVNTINLVMNKIIEEVTK